jgi:group I intron endonuclease
MTGIYAIINTINGKRYVGQAVNIKNRINGHLKRLRAGKHHCAHLQSAFQKYGQESFTYSTLEECPVEALTEREQYWMDYYRDKGIYNTAPAAGSNLGIKFNAEARAKMAAKLTGRPVSAESRLKMSESRMGWKPSDETRAKMSAAKRNMSDETKARMSAAHKGVKLSEMTRASMSKARKGKPHCGHVLTAKDNANREGCTLTEEQKAKVSASLVGNKRRLGTVTSPETRAKLSEATKRYWETKKTLQQIERIG